MISNFRDIGGINVPSGKIKSGFFYRSAQLSDINKEDQLFLKNKCQIKKIDDLRSKVEIKLKPDVAIEGVAYENIDVLASQENNMASFAGIFTAKGFDGEALKKLNIGTSLDIHKMMLETYGALITSDSAKAGYAKFLNELLEKREPLLFHCFSGKDRTGIAAALLLKISGASDQQILDDYLKSNIGNKLSNQEIINSLKGDLSPEQLKAFGFLLDVDKSYLIHAKEVLIENFGTFENYLKKGLHLSDDYVTQFRATFIQ